MHWLYASINKDISFDIKDVKMKFCVLTFHVLKEGSASQFFLFGP